MCSRPIQLYSKAKTERQRTATSLVPALVITAKGHRGCRELAFAGEKAKRKQRESTAATRHWPGAQSTETPSWDRPPLE
jgi:hypothetical protein